MVLAFLLALTRIGIIGADTYHSVAFTKYLNGPKTDSAFADFRVTAVYKGGSADIESSMSLLKANVPQLEKLGAEFVETVDDLLAKCDAVLLETNDGREHLAQAEKVFKTGKVPVSPEESLEVMAFMTAARMSAANGGRAVKIADVLAEVVSTKTGGSLG